MNIYLGKEKEQLHTVTALHYMRSR